MTGVTVSPSPSQCAIIGTSVPVDRCSTLDREKVQKKALGRIKPNGKSSGTADCRRARSDHRYTTCANQFLCGAQRGGRKRGERSRQNTTVRNRRSSARERGNRKMGCCGFGLTFASAWT